MGQKIKKNFILSLVLLAVFFIAGFFLIHPAPQKFENGNVSDNSKYVKVGGQDVRVDLAITPAEHNQGLSGRASLDPKDGMLFIFDRPGKYNFWMKDMDFPIDIIWIGEDLEIVYIKDNALPEMYPETYYPSQGDGDAKYVLEVVSGFSKKNNLKMGDSVEFSNF